MTDFVPEIGVKVNVFADVSIDVEIGPNASLETGLPSGCPTDNQAFACAAATGGAAA